MTAFPSRPEAQGVAMRRRLLNAELAEGLHVVDGAPFSGIGYRRVDEDRVDAVRVEGGVVVGSHRDEWLNGEPLVDLDVWAEENPELAESLPDYWHRDGLFTGWCVSFQPSVLSSIVKVVEGDPLWKIAFDEHGLVLFESRDTRRSPGSQLLVRESVGWHADGALRWSSIQFFDDDDDDGDGDGDGRRSVSMNLSEDGRLEQLRLDSGYFDERRRRADELTLWSLADLEVLKSLDAASELTLSVAEEFVAEVVGNLGLDGGFSQVADLTLHLKGHDPVGSLGSLLAEGLSSLRSLHVRSASGDPLGCYRYLRDLHQSRADVTVTFGYTVFGSAANDVPSVGWPDVHPMLYLDSSRSRVVGVRGLQFLEETPEVLDDVLTDDALRFVTTSSGTPKRVGDLEELVASRRPDVQFLRSPAPGFVAELLAEAT